MWFCTPSKQTDHVACNYDLEHSFFCRTSFYSCLVRYLQCVYLSKIENFLPILQLFRDCWHVFINKDYTLFELAIFRVHSCFIGALNATALLQSLLCRTNLSQKNSCTYQITHPPTPTPKVKWLTRNYVFLFPRAKIDKKHPNIFPSVQTITCRPPLLPCQPLCDAR